MLFNRVQNSTEFNTTNLTKILMLTENKVTIGPPLYSLYDNSLSAIFSLALRIAGMRCARET